MTSLRDYERYGDKMGRDRAKLESVWCKASLEAQEGVVSEA